MKAPRKRLRGGNQGRATHPNGIRKRPLRRSYLPDKGWRYPALVDVEDGGRLAAAITARLDRLTFTDLTADEVTARVIDAVVGWGADQGWRVYRRAPSVLPLPPPLSRQHSVLDVACARPAGPPLAIEVDRTDRTRTVEKLVAEANAGRIAFWVRWGVGPFVDPQSPVHLVPFVVTRRNGPAGVGRLYSRMPVSDRPPPPHSVGGEGTAAVVELPMPLRISESH